MPFTLPQLPYATDALEPHIDAQTMSIHHGKHHAAYVDKLNAALEGTERADKDIEDIITSIDQLPQDKQSAVRNNGGGHYNHSLFWTMMTPQAGDIPADLAEAINNAFGSIDEFKQQFATAGQNQFGSGWAWLIADQGALSVVSTPNQDNPKMTNPNCDILLGVDVWEHAYYLTYQNRRPEYLENWWNVVNWSEVERRWRQAMDR